MSQVELNRFFKTYKPVRRREQLSCATSTGFNIVEAEALLAGTEYKNQNGNDTSSGTAAEILADTMTECAVGVMPVPLGVVANLQVNSTLYHVPLATEEPSVCAAAAFGAKILGNITARCAPPTQDAQIALRDVAARGEAAFKRAIPTLCNKLMAFLSSMQKRGGGIRALHYYRSKPHLFVVLLRVDVQDAQGANAVNTAAEYIAPDIARVTGGAILSSIISNFTDTRFARAECDVPVATIPLIGAGRHGSRGKETLAENIELMCQWAHSDIRRATTHNKGILNGVSAFAVATGNDTRAIEASAHAHASVSGAYGPLSNFIYNRESGILRGSIELPALFASVGGGTAHPVAQWTRAVLDINRSKKNNYKNSASAKHAAYIPARELNKIAAALGLAQNFAALRALVSEGIQGGHMNLHAKRQAS